MINSLALDYAEIRKERAQTQPNDEADEDEEDDIIAASQAFPAEGVQDQEQDFQDEGGGERGGGPYIEGNVGGMDLDEPQEPKETRRFDLSAIPPQQQEDLAMGDAQSGSANHGLYDDLSNNDAFGVGQPSEPPHIILSNSSVESHAVANGARPFYKADARELSSSFDHDPAGATEDAEKDRHLLDSPRPSVIPDSQPGQSQVIPPNFDSSPSRDDAYMRSAYNAAEALQNDNGAFDGGASDCRPVTYQQARGLTGDEVGQGRSAEEDDQPEGTGEEEEEQPEGYGEGKHRVSDEMQEVALEANGRNVMRPASSTAGRKGKGKAVEDDSDSESSDDDIEEVTADYGPGSDIYPSNNDVLSVTANLESAEGLRQMRNAHKLSEANERTMHSASAHISSRSPNKRLTGPPPTPPVAGPRTNEMIVMRAKVQDSSNRPEGSRAALALSDDAPGSKRDRTRPDQMSKTTPASAPVSGQPIIFEPRQATTQPSPPPSAILSASQLSFIEPAIDPLLHGLQASTSLQSMLEEDDTETRSKPHIFGSDGSSSPRTRPSPLPGFPKALPTLFGEDTTLPVNHTVGIASSVRSVNDMAGFTQTRREKDRVVPPPAAQNQPEPESEATTGLPPTTAVDRHPRSSSSAPEEVPPDELPEWFRKRDSKSPVKTYGRPKPKMKPGDRRTNLSSDEEESDLDPEGQDDTRQQVRHDGTGPAQLSSIIHQQAGLNDLNTAGPHSVGFPSKIEVELHSGSKSARSRRGIRDSPHPKQPLERRESARQALRRSVSPSKDSRTTSTAVNEASSSQLPPGDTDLFASSSIWAQNKKLKRHTSGSGLNRTEDGAAGTSKRPRTNDKADSIESDLDTFTRPDFQGNDDPRSISYPKSTSLSAPRSTPHRKHLQPSNNKKYSEGSKVSIKPSPRQTTIHSWTGGIANGGGVSSSISAPAVRSERTAKMVAKDKLLEQGRDGSEGSSNHPIDIGD